MKPDNLDATAAALEHVTGSDMLPELLRAKYESDRENYPAKHAVLRRLILQRPDLFTIDSESAGILGLTHTPTNFRIHAPATVLPGGVRLRRMFSEGR